jgi:hypothetical protein
MYDSIDRHADRNASPHELRTSRRSQCKPALAGRRDRRIDPRHARARRRVRTGAARILSEPRVARGTRTLIIPRFGAPAWEILGVALLLLLLRLPFGIDTNWFQTLRHPVACLSRCEFLLESTALVALWAAVSGSALRRATIAVASIAGGVTLAVILSPCGAGSSTAVLSGLVQGLLIAGMLDTVRRLPRGDTLRSLALIVAIGAVTKTAFELITGYAVTAPVLHGALGPAVPEFHTGSLLGSLAVMAVWEVAQRITGAENNLSVTGIVNRQSAREESLANDRR